MNLEKIERWLIAIGVITTIVFVGLNMHKDIEQQESIIQLYEITAAQQGTIAKQQRAITDLVDLIKKLVDEQEDVPFRGEVAMKPG